MDGGCFLYGGQRPTFRSQLYLLISGSREGTQVFQLALQARFLITSSFHLPSCSSLSTDPEPAQTLELVVPFLQRVFHRNCMVPGFIYYSLLDNHPIKDAQNDMFTYYWHLYISIVSIYKYNVPLYSDSAVIKLGQLTDALYLRIISLW